MSKQRGFTLIELLVVIAIIGILASIILASLSTAQAKGRDARRVSDIKELQLALELYYDANNSYPPTPLKNNVSGLDSGTNNLVSNGYISSIPNDPSGGNDYYGYEGLEMSGGVWANCPTAGQCTNYVLAAQLESANAALSNPSGSYPALLVNSVSSTCGGSTPTVNLFCAVGE